jgi:hypothetical protein
MAPHHELNILILVLGAPFAGTISQAQGIEFRMPKPASAEPIRTDRPIVNLVQSIDSSVAPGAQLRAEPHRHD